MLAQRSTGPLPYFMVAGPSLVAFCVRRNYFTDANTKELQSRKLSGLGPSRGNLPPSFMPPHLLAQRSTGPLPSNAEPASLCVPMCSPPAEAKPARRRAGMWFKKIGAFLLSFHHH